MSSEVRPSIDRETVRRLISRQFPEYRELAIEPVSFDGWDNRTFRLGDELSVRMPSAEGYVPGIEKEQRWLPFLAPFLPLPIPAPVAIGRPDDDYPFPWSINRWLSGTSAVETPVADLSQFATDLAAFLNALQSVPTTNGPIAGAHSFYRGGSLAVYDAETRIAIATLADEIDQVAVTSIWDAALQSVWHGDPVWVHGDIAVGNLLVENDRLSAVIDFGTSSVGDPAADTVIAWTLFGGESRTRFREQFAVSPDTWVRGRGWALWKALITIARWRDEDSGKADFARHMLNQVMRDPS